MRAAVQQVAPCSDHAAEAGDQGVLAVNHGRWQATAMIPKNKE
jgi:hypothetical protein